MEGIGSVLEGIGAALGARHDEPGLQETFRALATSPVCCSPLRGLSAALDTAQSEHSRYLAIRDATVELDRMGIPRPHIDTGHDVWLPFLASAIVAAEEGDSINIAGIMSDEGKPFWRYNQDEAPKQGFTATHTSPPPRHVKDDPPQ